MKHRLIFTFFMSCLLSFFMTLWVTYLNLGYTSHFFHQWMHAFQMAWPAAFVISFFTAPLAQSLTLKLIDNFCDPDTKKAA